MKKIPLRHYGELLVTYLRPQWVKAAWLLTLLLGSIGLQLLNPQIVRHFIDVATGTEANATHTLLLTALLFVGVGLAQQLVSAFTTYFSADVGWTATNMLRADLAKHVLRLDMSFHNGTVPGQLIERIDGDVTLLSTFFAEFVIKVLGSLILLAGVLGLLWLEDWRVSLALMVFAFGALLLLNQIRNIAIPAMSDERQANANLFGFVEERLAGIEDIRANGGGTYSMRRFFEVSRDLLQKAWRASVMRTLIWMITMFMFTLGVTVALTVGAFLFTQHSISLGTVYLFFQYGMLLRSPIEQISRQLQELQKAAAGIGRVQQLREVESTIKDGQDATLPGGALSVQFRDVSFGYNSAEMIFKNINFRLQPRQVLGVLGRTGSGKSTLTRLLFRLYDPTTGEVRLGDVLTQEVTLSDLRGRIGMVTQEVQLFHATVRDNLTFFDNSIADEQILAVLQDLGLQSWFAGLANGLDTWLEAGAGGLSAGEAQLLACGRVFLKDPGLVILDEPSSRLDPATESLIERAVDKLLHQRTGLIIAHRLATVQRADLIMVVEAGRIVEFGPREVLGNDPASHFYHLLQTANSDQLTAVS